MGVISPVGAGLLQTKHAIRTCQKGIRPLCLFPAAHSPPLPVGEVDGLPGTGDVPRTHELAMIAAAEAMSGAKKPPDAIVMGVTTGGLSATEESLRKKDSNPDAYCYHAPGSVAEYLAGKYQCKGPAMTISTACSSGTAAMKLALEMLRSGSVRSVLTGGADSLCRLTYYGFNSLQLIDPNGAHPFDQKRRGMSVAEGAAMFLLVADDDVPDHAIAEVLGGGLSCDAYHPAAPHPQGEGARRAMLAAIQDAGIALADIDYVSLHGTGTLDNDLSEARAINALFGNGGAGREKPRMSSVKGALGHSLAAAGPTGVAFSAISICDGLIPANVGCDRPDPELSPEPVLKPLESEVRIALSNAFGFGGNNASLLLGHPGRTENVPSVRQPPSEGFSVVGFACFTGAGNTHQTFERLSQGNACKGMLPISEISEGLPVKTVRRLKRLPRLALSLTKAAHEDSGCADPPSSVFWGTGWGALSETYDFLTRLYESDERFTSPTDFIGSVHNAPAAQIAIQFQATGPNITTTGGDYSFEQALMAANLLSADTDDTLLVIGADEFHETLSGLFDRSVLADEIPSDGGGALCLRRSDSPGDPKIRQVFFENAENNPSVISSLIRSLGDAEAAINEKFAGLLLGIPRAYRKDGAKQLDEFLSLSGFLNPVIDYRKLTGEFASASAVAAVMAAGFIQKGEILAGLCGHSPIPLNGKNMLIIGLGRFVTAMETENGVRC